MKKITILFICFIIASATFAQTKQTEKQQVFSESILMRIDSLLQVNNALLRKIHSDNSYKQRFKLYPTENLYTFLQLDTMTGQIKQVQWNLDEEKEFSVSINSKDLNGVFDSGPGVYELYPTKNMYQFILINKITGAKWHVQWGLGDAKRWIREIY